jgi:hypothetical protein
MMTPFGIYDTKQGTLIYVGLHKNKEDCWKIYLGWPSHEEILDAQYNKGLRCIAVTCHYDIPMTKEETK